MREVDRVHLTGVLRLAATRAGIAEADDVAVRDVVRDQMQTTTRLQNSLARREPLADIDLVEHGVGQDSAIADLPAIRVDTRDAARIVERGLAYREPRHAPRLSRFAR